MGGSSSSEQSVQNEEREVENLAASTGSLPLLQSFFSKLSHSQSNFIPLQSLQQCFFVNYKELVYEENGIPELFRGLLDNVGSSFVDEFFASEKGGVSWVEFVKGYLKCCGRMPVSAALNALLRLFAGMAAKIGQPLKLNFEFDADDDGKISGFLVPSEVHMLLWICWTLLWDSKTSSLANGREILRLPDIDHLVLSAVVSCVEVESDLNLWDCNVLGLEVEIPVGKFLTWVLTTVPCLTECFTDFVNARLQKNLTTLEDKSDRPSSSTGEISPGRACNTHLLSLGRAWAISLTLKSEMNKDILKPYFSGECDQDENLLYQSSLHGRGLNRFWSNVEGYLGPVLVLILATCGDNHQENNSDVRKWIIGAVTLHGFENKDTFYGTSGSLYAICPVFHVFSPSGKEKNFVYSHLHPTGRVYEARPKPEGIAFGGTIGNERIFIDEDFAKITVRHHAYDKTYQPGPLFPDQGFLPVEASILDFEVWGLGGKKAKQVQTSYKKREELFTEQRRKVDLKNFAWEDSPEKMMMDMMSNPNQPAKEER